MGQDFHLTSAGAPNGLGDIHWETPEDVRAVPEKLAVQLLRIQGGGYAIAEPYEALPKKRPAKPTEEPPAEVPAVITGDTTAGNPLGEALELTSAKGSRSRKAS